MKKPKIDYTYIDYTYIPGGTKTRRTVPSWADTKVLIDLAAYGLPSTAGGASKWFASFPSDACVQVNEGDPGRIEISWTEDATEEDLLEYRSKQEKKAADVADRAEFEAWRERHKETQR